MKAHRTVEYRLLPCTKAKAKALFNLAGACRYVWNQVLDLQNETYDVITAYGGTSKDVPKPTFETLGTLFTQLRRHTTWLQELHAATVRYTLKYQADAWKFYFKHRKQGAGKPLAHA